MAQTPTIKIKKKWVSIVAPKLFDNKELGESYCLDSNSLLNRHVTVSLMFITNDPKKQSINLSFKINSIKGDVANTELVGYEISPVHVRRMAKKSKMKVEDSYVCVSKDGINVRVKPLVLTKAKIFNSVATSMRKSIKEFIEAYLKKNTFEQFAQSVMNNDLQKDMRNIVKKIYPATSSLIRVFKIEASK